MRKDDEIFNCSNRMTDNELIAEFMGLSHRKVCGPLTGDEYIEVMLYDRWVICKYDCSWDWIMNVVEKIHSLKVSDIKTEFSKIHVLSLPIHSPIDRVHDEVSKFAKWYNENKKA